MYLDGQDSACRYLRALPLNLAPVEYTRDPDVSSCEDLKALEFKWPGARHRRRFMDLGLGPLSGSSLPDLCRIRIAGGVVLLIGIRERQTNWCHGDWAGFLSSGYGAPRRGMSETG